MQEWKGYLYASLFFLSSVLSSFFFHQLFHIGMTTGMRLKASLIAAIYEKVSCSRAFGFCRLPQLQVAALTDVGVALCRR